MFSLTLTGLSPRLYVHFWEETQTNWHTQVGLKIAELMRPSRELVSCFYIAASSRCRCPSHTTKKNSRSDMSFGFYSCQSSCLGLWAVLGWTDWINKCYWWMNGLQLVWLVPLLYLVGQCRYTLFSKLSFLLTYWQQLPEHPEGWQVTLEQELGTNMAATDGVNGGSSWLITWSVWGRCVTLQGFGDHGAELIERRPLLWSLEQRTQAPLEVQSRVTWWRVGTKALF